MTHLINAILVDSDRNKIGVAMVDANVTVAKGNDDHIYEKIDDYTFRRIDPPTMHVNITPPDER